MKRIFEHLQQNWIRYGFESVAILISILAAFALNNWNENRKEYLQKEELVKSIITDLNIKRDEIIYDIENIRKTNNMVIETVDIWHKQHYLDPQSIAPLIALIRVGSIHFGEKTQAYAGASSSDVWKQLPDSLIREITNLHYMRFTMIKTKYAAIASHSQSITLNYLVPNNLHRSQLQPEELHQIIMKNPEEFFSYVTLFESHMTNVLGKLTRALTASEKVIADLQYYLNAS